MLPKTIMTRKGIRDRKEGGMSHFSKSESAAATALAAVLLLALVFTMIAVVKLEYVPDWKNDAERDHMYNTLDDMTGVKTNIDMLSRLTKLNNYSSHNISVTVPVDMGGGQIPFLEPSKSDGKLGVNTERYAMTIVPRTSSPIINPYTLKPYTLKPYTFECGGITCYSENRQYPDQIFRYENGALILANDKGSVMRQPPAFTIENENGHYKVAVQVVQLSGKPNSISSNTIIPLQLKGDSNQLIYDSNDYKNTTLDYKNITLQNLNAFIKINGFNLTIATRYPDAWIAYFNEIAQENRLDYGKDYTVQYLQGSGHVRFSFLPNGTKTLERLYISKATIGAEFGTGNNFSYDHSTNVIGNVMKLKQWYFFDTFNGTYGQNSIPAGNTDPNVLKDRNESYLLPSGNFTNQTLGSYSGVNDFNYIMAKGKTLDLNFGFNNFSSFSSTSTPTKATILMIYSFSSSYKPNIVMTVAGAGNDTFKPNDGWCLYNKTLSISPIDPEDITLNLKVTTDNVNSAAGTFRIDYLAVYLS